MSPIARLLAALLLLALPAAARAQDAALPRAPRQVLSIQPLALVTGVLSGEAERALGRNVSIGVGGTRVSDVVLGTGVRYASGDVKLRYYPSGTPLAGFSVGVQGGYSLLTGQMTDGDGGAIEGSLGGPTYGVSLDYSWLLGASRSFAIAIGGGMKTYRVQVERFDASIPATLPTGRVSIGWAF